MEKEDVRNKWEIINDYLLMCGSKHELYPFGITIVQELRNIIDFDNALVYYLDGNRKVYTQYCWNMAERWANVYREYYTRQGLGLYDVTSGESGEKEGKPYVLQINWKKVINPDLKEFVDDYIRPQGIVSTLSFPLSDTEAVPRTVFSLGRTRSREFEEKDMEFLRTVTPHLNNLHKNFFAMHNMKEDTNYSVIYVLVFLVIINRIHYNIYKIQR